MNIEDDLWNEKIKTEVEKRVTQEVERIADNPDAVIAAYAKKLATLERKSELDRPKVEFAEAVQQSKDYEEMSTVAKLLGVKGFGRNNIFGVLRERKILRGNNEPYQRYVERGYFKVVEQTWMNKQTGETMISKKTVASQRGIDFIRRILAEEDA